MLWNWGTFALGSSGLGSGLARPPSFRGGTIPLFLASLRKFWFCQGGRARGAVWWRPAALPLARWHEQIGDPKLADDIPDRSAHNAHLIEMRGDSMRKNRGKTTA